MSEKYAFIAAEYAANQAAEVAVAPTVETMCHWLSVSKSGYYEWKNRPASATQQRRDLLKIKIKTLFDSFAGTYGYVCHERREEL